MNKILTCLTPLLIAGYCPAAVTVSSITETQFTDHTTDNLSWVAGAQAGNLSEKEVGLLSTTNYSSFTYTEEYYDSTHTGWDISSAQTTFPPVAMVSETRFSLVYDGSDITLNLGPTEGRTSYDLEITQTVTDDFNHLALAVFSEGVQNDTHLRMRDLVFSGQFIGTLDAWGGTGAAGSNSFDGLSLTGVSDSVSWTLVGIIEFDYQGGLGNGFPEDDDFQFRILANEIASVPEPSSVALLGITSIAVLIRRKR